MQLSAWIADHLHLELLPAEHALLDQHLVRRRGIEPALDDLGELLPVVADAAARAAQREGRPDDRGQADVLERPHRLLAVVGEHRLGRRKADPVIASRNSLRSSAMAMASALAPIISTPNLASTPALSSASAVLSAVCPPMVGSSASGRSCCDDLGDHLGRDRLDVGGVRQLRVRHDRGRIGIDQDDAVALGFQGLAGLGAGIVELAGLSDDDGARADDEDGLDIRALRHEAASYCSAMGLAIAAARLAHVQLAAAAVDAYSIFKSPSFRVTEGKSSGTRTWLGSTSTALP